MTTVKEAPAALLVLTPRTLAQLAVVFVDKLPDGAICRVLDVGTTYVLDKYSVSAVSGVGIIATAAGASKPGRWRALPGTAAQNGDPSRFQAGNIVPFNASTPVALAAGVETTIASAVVPNIPFGASSFMVDLAGSVELTGGVAGSAVTLKWEVDNGSGWAQVGQALVTDLAITTKSLACLVAAAATGLATGSTLGVRLRATATTDAEATASNAVARVLV